MPKCTEARLFLGGLAAFALWLFVALPLLYGPSQQTPQINAQQHSKNSVKNETGAKPSICDDKCGTQSQHGSEEGTEFWPPLFGYRLKVTDTLIALFTAGLFVATWFLYWATRDLVNSTVRIESRQSEETKIIQHAGHLPAHHVAWFLDKKYSENASEKDFPIGDLGGDIVMAPQARARKGAGPTDRKTFQQERGKGKPDRARRLSRRVST